MAELHVKRESVKVFVRTRPSVYFSEKSINIHEDKQNVSVQVPRDEAVVNSKTKEWTFSFHGILHNTSQEELYSTCVSDVVEQSIRGYSGTVLAYGQIGAGKTYTMIGASNTYRLRGIIPRVISQLYRVIRDENESIITVKVSYLEVYNEIVNDLLQTLPDATDFQQKSPLPIAMSHTVKPALDEEEALNMLFEGEMNRVVKEHPINSSSSRSHVIYTLYIENQSKTSCSSAYTTSTLHLVDLAGHDRAHKSQVTRDASREVAYINKSLLYLEQMAVFQHQKLEYLSHRQSKLTRVLSNSIGGNGNTVLILNVWGDSKYLTETVSTLKFGNQLLTVQNQPTQNVQYSTKNLLTKYQEDIKVLEEELAMQNILCNRDSVGYEALGETQVIHLHHNIKQYLEGATHNIEIATCREMKAAFAHMKHIINTLEEGHSKDIAELQSQIRSLENKVSQTKVSITSTTTSDSEPIKETKSKKLLKKTIPVTPSVTDDDDAMEVVGNQGSEGFGLGKAPGSMKHGSMHVKKKISFAKNIPIMIDTGTAKKKPVDDNQEFCVEEDPAPMAVSTPPSRSEAFEMFKKGRGKEINKIFLQNKQLYQRKKKELYEISCQMNDHKYILDKIQQELKSLGSHMTDHMTTTDGRLIINEHEYNLWTKLKECKDQYKTKATKLKVLQSEVPYCEKYTQESRKKLLTEFDTWFKMAFIGSTSGEEGRPTSDDKGEGITTDDKINVATNVDRFDQLQTLYLKGDPSTTAYYRSQLRTEKRAREYSHKRVPGQVIQTVRNKPPGHLVFT